MTTKNVLLISCSVFVLGILIGSGFTYAKLNPSLGQEKTPVSAETTNKGADMAAQAGASVGTPPDHCTYDSSTCPDGTVLYRVLPKCDYPACPGTTGSVGTTTGS